MPSHAQTHFRVRLLAAAASALVFAPLAHAQANPTLTIDTPGPGGMAHVVTATDNMGVTVTGAGIANIGGGGRVSIDGRTPMSYVRTTNGGTSFISEINISGNGGISQNSALATAMYGSTVTLIDSSIRNSGDVAFWAARGNMDMNVPGSTVHMDNVILEGNGRALVVGGDSTVDVRNSHIEATRRDGARMNYAVQVTDSQFTAVDTTISGSDAAVKITTESRPQRAGSTVVLDNARLIAEGAGNRGANVPEAIARRRDIVHVASTAGAFAALTRSGTVVAWGNTSQGGNAAPVAGQLTDIVALYSSTEAFCAVRATGGVVTWGVANGGATIPAAIRANLDTNFFYQATAGGLSLATPQGKAAMAATV